MTKCAQRLRQTIRSLGTQQEFALRIDTAQATVSRWCKGRDEPSNHSWVRIERATGLPRSWFYGENSRGETSAEDVRAHFARGQELLAELMQRDEVLAKTVTPVGAEGCLMVPVYAAPPTEPWPPAKVVMPVLLSDLESVSETQQDRLYILLAEALAGQGEHDHTRYIILAGGEVREGQQALVRSNDEYRLMPRIHGQAWPVAGVEVLGRVVLSYVVKHDGAG